MMNRRRMMVLFITDSRPSLLRRSHDSYWIGQTEDETAAEIVQFQHVWALNSERDVKRSVRQFG